MAELIGARALEAVFTSCGTESNDAAIAAALQSAFGAESLPRPVPPAT